MYGEEWYLYFSKIDFLLLTSVTCWVMCKCPCECAWKFGDIQIFKQAFFVEE